MVSVLRRPSKLSPAFRSIGIPRSIFRNFLPSQVLRPGTAIHLRYFSMAPNQETEQSRQAQGVKVPKGTRDWFGADVILRDHILCVSL